MKASLVCCFLIAGLYACHKQEDSVLDSNGLIIKQISLWKTSISDDGQLVQVVSEAHISYDRNVLVGGNKSQNRSLISLNVETGKVNWEWNVCCH